MTPAESRVVDADGVPMSALVREAAEPRAVILALHGGATTSRYFDLPGRPRQSLLRADVDEQAGSGHNLSVGLPTMAYHLKVLSFAEECVLARTTALPASGAPELGSAAAPCGGRGGRPASEEWAGRKVRRLTWQAPRPSRCCWCGSWWGSP